MMDFQPLLQSRNELLVSHSAESAAKSILGSGPRRLPRALTFENFEQDERIYYEMRRKTQGNMNQELKKNECSVSQMNAKNPMIKESRDYEGRGDVDVIEDLNDEDTDIFGIEDTMNQVIDAESPLLNSTFIKGKGINLKGSTNMTHSIWESGRASNCFFDYLLEYQTGNIGSRLLKKILKYQYDQKLNNAIQETPPITAVKPKSGNDNDITSLVEDYTSKFQRIWDMKTDSKQKADQLREEHAIVNEVGGEDQIHTIGGVPVCILEEAKIKEGKELNSLETCRYKILHPVELNIVSTEVTKLKQTPVPLESHVLNVCSSIESKNNHPENSANLETSVDQNINQMQLEMVAKEVSEQSLTRTNVEPDTLTVHRVDVCSIVKTTNNQSEKSITSETSVDQNPEQMKVEIVAEEVNELGLIHAALKSNTLMAHRVAREENQLPTKEQLVTLASPDVDVCSAAITKHQYNNSFTAEDNLVEKFKQMQIMNNLKNEATMQNVMNVYLSEIVFREKHDNILKDKGSIVFLIEPDSIFERRSPLYKGALIHIYTAFPSSCHL